MLPRNLFRRIAPVGNPISLKTCGALPALLDDPRIRLVQSGTAALAAAVSVAKMAKPVDGKPEIIIPAYCCPDVVAAVVYNNCTPVLVDFIADRPYMDIDAIKNAITTNTIAVIAVNFLGIPERCKQIREAFAAHNIVLIEDSAQWFPEQGNLFDNYEGDLVVLSFGKGKPVSLLGGGALICRNPTLPLERLQLAVAQQSSPAWRLRLLLTVYNLAIHPLLHWMLELVPFIEMGVTRYKPLAVMAAFDSGKIPFLQENIEKYRRRQAQHAAVATDHNNGGIDLPAVCETYHGQRLLRYPLLMANRDRAQSAIEYSKQQGQGRSPLYQHTLDAISETDRLVSSGAATVNAKSFAQRLVTLPTHLYSSHAK
jgi:dTDP-4-amino-4,6-dideoxygalactose transaminase